MSNEVAQSNKLSLKAKGLLSYLLSKPNDWEFAIDRIKREILEGRDAIMSGLQELETISLLKRERQYDGKVRYVIASCFRGIEEYETTDLATVGKSHSGKTRPLYKKEVLTKKELVSKDTNQTQFGNKLVNFVLEEFKTLTGFTPTDQRPRNYSHNLIRKIQKIVKEAGFDPKSEDGNRRVKALITAYFGWLKAQEWDVQKMQTVYFKFQMFQGLEIERTIHEKN